MQESNQQTRKLLVEASYNFDTLEYMISFDGQYLIFLLYCGSFSP